MTVQRVEVRLDPEHRKKLEMMAEDDTATISELLRQMIDERFEERLRKRRIAAAERLVSREIEEVPDPDELSRQLDETHDPGKLYD